MNIQVATTGFYGSMVTKRVFQSKNFELDPSWEVEDVPKFLDAMEEAFTSKKPDNDEGIKKWFSGLKLREARVLPIGQLVQVQANYLGQVVGRTGKGDTYRVALLDKNGYMFAQREDLLVLQEWPDFDGMHRKVQSRIVHSEKYGITLRLIVMFVRSYTGELWHAIGMQGSHAVRAPDAVATLEFQAQDFTVTHESWTKANEVFIAHAHSLLEQTCEHSGESSPPEESTDKVEVYEYWDHPVQLNPNDGLFRV